MPHDAVTASEQPTRSQGRRALRSEPSGNAYEPRHTVRCIGEAKFRSQAARDAACLLDVDADVVAWTCMTEPLTDGDHKLAVDLAVTRTSGRELLVVAAQPENFSALRWAEEAAAERGAVLRVVPADDLAGDRLENSRELLRYAKWRVSLSQRIVLLAALDQEGSLSLIECMSAVRGAADPIGAVAALALRRFVEIDLDSGPLGPETRVTRFRG